MILFQNDNKYYKTQDYNFQCNGESKIQSTSLSMHVQLEAWIFIYNNIKAYKYIYNYLVLW